MTVCTKVKCKYYYFCVFWLSFFISKGILFIRKIVKGKILVKWGLKILIIVKERMQCRGADSLKLYKSDVHLVEKYKEGDKKKWHVPKT
jgi:hypothetical protein